MLLLLAMLPASPAPAADPSPSAPDLFRSAAAEPDPIRRRGLLLKAAQAGSIEAAARMALTNMFAEMSLLDPRAPVIAGWSTQAGAEALSGAQIHALVVANWGCRNANRLGDACDETMRAARRELADGAPRHPLVLAELAWLHTEIEPVDKPEARRCFERCLEELPAALRTGDDEHACGLLADVATVAVSCGFADEAPSLLKQLRERAGHDAFWSGEHEFIVGLTQAPWSVDDGDPEVAAATFERSRVLFDAVGYPLLAARAMSGRAGCLARLDAADAPARAAALFDAAADLYLAQGATNEAAALHERAAKALAPKAGADGAWEQAAAEHLASARLFEQVGDRSSVARAIAWAGIMEAHGDPRRMTDAAREHLRRALAMFTELKQEEDAKRVREMLEVDESIDRM